MITPEVFVAGTTSSVISRVTNPKWLVNGRAISEVGGTAGVSAPYALTIKQPEVFVAGTTSSVISRVTNPKWLVNGRAISEVGGTAGVSAPYALTIKQNMAKATSYNVEFTGTYTDAETGLQTPVKAVITLNKVETGTASPVITVQQPQGMDFINDTPTSLTAVAMFLRGGQEDTTNVTYKWEKQESGGTWTVITDAGGFTGSATKTLTISKDAVLNFLNVRVTVTEAGVRRHMDGYYRCWWIYWICDKNINYQQGCSAQLPQCTCHRDRHRYGFGN